jgi:putative aminopeptidase FrvX
VTAHYDSVPAGPGASDDGVGTAVVLELAREMARRKTENDFIFLITDGEETGLRGAYAFAQRHRAGAVQITKLARGIRLRHRERAAQVAGLALAMTQQRQQTQGRTQQQELGTAS